MKEKEQARLEKLSDNPLIIFDGGHNENAVKNLEENSLNVLNNMLNTLLNNLTILIKLEYSLHIQPLIKKFLITLPNVYMKLVLKKYY